MKYPITFIFLSLLLTSCGRNDAKIQQRLSGTWDIDRGFGVHGTLVVSPDGSIKSQFTGFTNGFILQVEGTLLAKDGGLIETVTKVNETNGTLPRSIRGRIVHLNDHELVVRWDGMKSDIVSQKVER
jgi:hypothetical protein